MKTAALLSLFLAGSALAIPLAQPAKETTGNVSEGSKESICDQAGLKVFDKCRKTLQCDESEDRCNEERDDAKQQCLDVQVQNGAVVGKDKDSICTHAAGIIFGKCLKTLQRDEPEDRCNEERDDAKQECLDVEVQNGVVVDGKDVRKKKAECAIPGNRAFAACMKDMFTNKKSRETRESCDQKKESATEACMKGEKPEPASPSKPSDSKKEDEKTETASPSKPSDSEKEDEKPETASLSKPSDSEKEDKKPETASLSKPSNSEKEDEKPKTTSPSEPSDSKKEDESTEEQPDTSTEECQ